MSDASLIGIKIRRSCGKVEEIELEFDKVEFVIENGINRLPGLGAIPVIEPNGQSRMILRAWTGCERFEDFLAETDWG